ncbi:PP2C family protein-serine/threonine phosphatase [Kitasatospora sp. NPDC088783]|uniref:PP2C family protein-serine/threonine phosphatase n=1 Tax=Kitasatospora sp. NPDC088783 TaxID=3364077 RepID=UPI0038251099
MPPSASASRHAAAQLRGLRAHQCDATATYTAPDGARAYVLLDGIGDTPAVSAWVRSTARWLARACAVRGDAEAGVRAVYTVLAARSAAEAAAVAAVAAPGRPLTVAWAGDTRAYLLGPDGLERLTEDHNMRRVEGPGGDRNTVTSCLGSELTDAECRRWNRHPAVESTVRPAGACRLLLASDGAYEPIEDDGAAPGLAALTATGSPRTAAHALVRQAVDRSAAATRARPYGPHADNATVLIADLRP